MLTTTIKQLCGLAGVVSIGFALSAPAALAETRPETANSEQETNTLLAQAEMAFAGNPECPGPDGGFAPSPHDDEFEFEPDQDYSLECWDLERTGFICVNNPNPECENPVHYGQIYGTQYTSPVEGLVDQYWQEIGTAPEPTLPPPASTPPPPVAPVPGLW